MRAGWWLGLLRADLDAGADPFVVTNGSMTITAMSDPAVDGEFAAHPGTVPTYNYW